MELDEYLRILLRRWPIWLFAIILGGGLAFGWTATRPQTFDGVATLSIVKKVVPSAERTGDFQFDNYYSLETSRGLVQLAAGWLNDPTVIADIYAQAEVKLPDVAISRYHRLMGVAILPGTTLQIATNASTAAAAAALARQAQTSITNRLNDLVAGGTLDAMQVLSSQPLNKEKETGWSVALLAGLTAGALFGLVLSFMVETVKQRR